MHIFTGIVRDEIFKMRETNISVISQREKGVKMAMFNWIFT